MDPSLVQVKKIKKEDARLPSETSRQLPDSEPKCDKLKTSRSPPPLLMNLRLQVWFAIFEYLQSIGSFSQAGFNQGDVKQVYFGIFLSFFGLFTW